VIFNTFPKYKIINIIPQADIDKKVVFTTTSKMVSLFQTPPKNENINVVMIKYVIII